MADPIIVDTYSFSTVPIEMYFRDTLLSAGTAFLWKSKDARYRLITNWHNVSGVDPSNDKNLSPTGGRPDRIVAHFVQAGQLGARVARVIPLRDDQGRATWFVHPLHGKAIDAVAMPIQISDEVDWGFAINILENDDARLAVEIGQDVFILGYPFGYGPHGFPVWKRASVASEPKLILPSQQYMLVDTASRPGMSGSPVIRRTWGTHVFEGGGAATGPGPCTMFVGIYSGRLTTKDPLDAQLGLVWRAALIREIVEGQVRDTFQ